MNTRTPIELLESRRLLTIIINGTAAADVLTVERAGSIINVNLNGTPSTRTIGSETTVQINGLGGGDTINVPDMADLDLTVLCGTGNDALTIGGTGGNGSSFDFDATVLSGEGGTDSVLFSDSINYGNPVEGQRYELAGGVFRTTRYLLVGGDQTTASHDYDFETVTLTAGAEDSAFYVRSVGSESSVSINAGSGGDILVFNPFLSSATINFDGQGTGPPPPPLPQQNRVIIEDSLGSGSAGDVYTLDEATFDRTGFGLLNFTNVDDVSLTTHNLGTVVNVVGVIPGSGNSDIKASVTGGAGNDVINVGNGDYDLNITGAVIVTGAGGTDSLAINDSTDAGSDGYDLNNNLFIKTNMNRGLNFFSFEQVSITGNSSGNAFDISTENAQTVNLFGQGGNDSFAVTPRAGSQLNIDGGAITAAPGDTLTFESAETAGSATFAGGTYQFESAEDVVLTSVELFPIPPAAPSVPDLRAEDDSGISFSDNVTNVGQPTFTGTAPANVTVVLSSNATQLGTGTASGTGAWSILSSALNDGIHPIAAASRIPSSGLTGPKSTALAVTIDTTAPPTPALPDLSTGSDTGLSFTDNITRDNTPQIDGNVAANDIVRLFVDGVLTASDTTTPSGSYSIVTPALADGSRQIVVKFEDLAGNASGLSPALTIGIDTVAPAAPTAAPDMTAGTDTGVSSSDNITRDATPTFTGSRPNDVAVLLVQTNVIYGQLLTTGTTSYSITTSSLDDGSYSFNAIFRDIAGNDSSAGPTVAVTVDTVAPTLTTPAAFNFLTGQNLKFQFSEDIGQTLSVADLGVQDLTHGGNVPGGSMAVSYAANLATFTFPGFANGTLPDADYRARMTGDELTDVAGNQFVGVQFDFFFLNGDANRDRRVNLADYNILAANFGQPNRNFSQGDFTYDGQVNLADYNILAGKFGTALGPEPAGSFSGRHWIGDETIEEELL